MSGDSGIPSPGPGATVGAERAAPLAAGQVDLVLTGWMVGLTFLWGFNAITIKMVTTAIAPLMSAAARGWVGLAAIVIYGVARRESFRFSLGDAGHALVIGVLFCAEFVLIYSAAPFTSGGHMSLFINTAPIVVAVAAHYLLPDERMHVLKVTGLVLAFGGVVLLFWDDLYVQQSGYWRGDLLVLAGAVAWAVTTIYMKRYLTARFSGFRLLLAQIAVSTPLLTLASLWREPDALAGADLASAALIVFQGVVVVFFSYMAWMVLLTRYPASGMQSFTFLSPVWGVVAGVVLLSEVVSLLMAAGMTLIGLGVFLVNRPNSASRQPR